MKKVVALLLLAATASCGESQPTQRARLHDPLAENEALLLVFPTETNIPPNAPGPYCHPTGGHSPPPQLRETRALLAQRSQRLVFACCGARSAHGNRGNKSLRSLAEKVGDSLRLGAWRVSPLTVGGVGSRMSG